MDWLQDAVLGAQANVQDIIRKVVTDMAAPRIRRMAQMKWANMTPEEKQAFKDKQPELYQELMQELQGEKYVSK